MDSSKEHGHATASGLGGSRTKASGGAQQQSEDAEVFGGCTLYNGELCIAPNFLYLNLGRFLQISV